MDYDFTKAKGGDKFEVLLNYANSSDLLKGDVVTFWRFAGRGKVWWFSKRAKTQAILGGLSLLTSNP